MRPIVTNGVASPVCLLEGRSQSWALQNGWTDRDAVLDVDSGGPKNHVLHGGLDRHTKGQFGGNVICTAYGWLKHQDQRYSTTESELWRNASQVHFSWRKLCWKLTKYDVCPHILWLTVSVYDLFERLSHNTCTIACECDIITMPVLISHMASTAMMDIENGVFQHFGTLKMAIFVCTCKTGSWHFKPFRRSSVFTKILDGGCRHVAFHVSSNAHHVVWNDVIYRLIIFKDLTRYNTNVVHSCCRNALSILLLTYWKCEIVKVNGQR